MSIKSAKAYAITHGYDRIIIIATTPKGVTYIETWGETIAKCKDAAKAQDWWNGKVFNQAKQENVSITKEP